VHLDGGDGVKQPVALPAGPTRSGQTVIKHHPVFDQRSSRSLSLPAHTPLSANASHILVSKSIIG
jgi:hypothetical protein